MNDDEGGESEKKVHFIFICFFYVKFEKAGLRKREKKTEKKDQYTGKKAIKGNLLKEAGKRRG